MKLSKYMYMYGNDPKFLDQQIGANDQDIPCVLFHFIILRYHNTVESLSLNFRIYTVKLVGVRKFRNFTVVRVT